MGVQNFDPKNPEFYFWNAGAKYRLKKYDAAISDFTKSIELLPEAAGAYKGRGDSKFFLNQFQESILDYNKAIEIIENNLIIYKKHYGSNHYKIAKIIIDKIGSGVIEYVDIPITRTAYKIGDFTKLKNLGFN